MANLADEKGGQRLKRGLVRGAPTTSLSKTSSSFAAPPKHSAKREKGACDEVAEPAWLVEAAKAIAEIVPKGEGNGTRREGCCEHSPRARSVGMIPTWA